MLMRTVYRFEPKYRERVEAEAARLRSDPCGDDASRMARLATLLETLALDMPQPERGRSKEGEYALAEFWFEREKDACHALLVGRNGRKAEFETEAGDSAVEVALKVGKACAAVRDDY